MFEKIFEKGKIGNLEIKNRIVMMPLAMGVATKKQEVGEDFTNYLMERVNGGVGMVILENTRVDDAHGVAAERQASVARDEQIAPLSKIAKLMHDQDVKIFTQLHHPGRETFSNINSNEPVWSSSSRPCGVCAQETHEMTTKEVEEIIEKFVAGAERSKKAGVDGVELHGAHGYLISQFLSPYTNKRTDRFGGSFENRFNFVKEIVLGIQKRCGKDFPVAIRLTVDELLNVDEDYLKLEDGVKVCQELEKLGLVYINVSNGIYESFNSLSEPMTYPQGCRSERIRAIKDAVKIPVMAVNMVKEPAFAEKMLEEGLVDFVGLGRALVADPEWVKKTKENRVNEINRCISCTYCFETLVSEAIAGKGPVRCAVNPRAGRETEFKTFKKDGDNRKVVVVGAGVSGLEAALVLKKRDFDVEIYEKEGIPGGQINYANKPPRKDKINWIIDYLQTELKLLGVEVTYNTTVTKEFLLEKKPYATMICTGGCALIPKFIPGYDLPNVHTLEEVLSSKPEIKNKNVVIVGSGISGLETAEFLLHNGNKVSIIEMKEQIGQDIYVQHYLDAMDKLSKFDVTYLPSCKLSKINSDSIEYTDLKENVNKTLKADEVVLAMGVKSNNCLYNEVKDEMKVYALGDASKVGRICDATRSAFDAAFYLE